MRVRTLFFEKYTLVAGHFILNQIFKKIDLSQDAASRAPAGRRPFRLGRSRWTGAMDLDGAQQTLMSAKLDCMEESVIDRLGVCPQGKPRKPSQLRAPACVPARRDDQPW